VEKEVEGREEERKIGGGTWAVFRTRDCDAVLRLGGTLKSPARDAMDGT